MFLYWSLNNLWFSAKTDVHVHRNRSVLARKMRNPRLMLPCTMYVRAFTTRSPYILSSHEAHPRAKQDKWVFSRLPIIVSLVESRSGSGKLFQSLGHSQRNREARKWQLLLPELVDHHEQLSASDGDWQWLWLARHAHLGALKMREWKMQEWKKQER